MRKTVNYIDKQEFYELMVEHRKKVKHAEENGLPIPVACDEIGRNIMQIAKGIGSRYNFSLYPYREELVSDGILDAVNAINKFDPESSNNPFGYFSTCIWYAFLRRIREEKKETYVKYKETEQAYLTGNLVGGDGEAFSGVIEDNEFRDDFIANYERSIDEKKARREQKKLEKSGPVDDVFEYDETQEDEE